MTKAKSSKRGAVPPLEWASAGFGLLVVLALLAIIGRGALAGDGHEVPLLTVTAGRVVATPTGHVVEVEVVNRSPVTAASVQIEGMTGGETSTATIDYVPGRSRGTGGLIFSRDPRAAGLDLRVTGYELP